MEKEIINLNDYADWLGWVSNAKRSRQTIFESKNCEGIPVLLQVHEPKDGDFNNFDKKSTLSNNDEINTRWKEICQKIQVDPNWDEQIYIYMEAPKVLLRCFCLESR
jgi:hypothetical protein